MKAQKTSTTQGKNQKTDDMTEKKTTKSKETQKEIRQKILKKREPEAFKRSDYVRIFGLDLSLTGSAIAVIDACPFQQKFEIVDYKAFTPAKKMLDGKHRDHFVIFDCRYTDLYDHRMHRLHVVSQYVLDYIDKHTLEDRHNYVGIEDYAFSQQSHRVSEIHEFGGLVKVGLWQAGLPFKLYSPTLVKGVCGVGGRDPKEASVAATKEIFSLDLDIALKYDGKKRYGYDLADAFLVAYTTLSDLGLAYGVEFGNTKSLKESGAYPDGYWREPFTTKNDGEYAVIETNEG